MANAVVVLLLAGVFQLSAQDSRVDRGVKALQDQDFVTAIETLDQALEYPAELTGDNHPRALYYRGLARIYLYNNAIMANDDALLESHGDAYLEAYNDLVSALEADNGNWQNRILKELEAMEPALTQFAMQYSELAGELKERGSVQSAGATLAKAEEYARAAIHVNDNYMARDAMGQVYSAYGDTDAARQEFTESILLYDRRKPAIPDFYQAYVYYRLAKAFLSHDPKPEAALGYIVKGKEFIRKEGERWNSMRGSVPEEERSRIDRLYRQADEDLSGYEYEMYFKYPELLAKGIIRMENAVKTDPQNYDLRVAYARLMEHADPESALKQYENARKIDPSKEPAWFNAGVICYNEGREYYTQAGKEEESEKFEVLAAAAKEYFSRAWPYFIQALDINPGNLDTVVALKNLALLLNRKPEYEKFSDMEEQMRNR